MVRLVVPQKDAADITRIYNKYIETTTVSFETEALSEEQMLERIETICRDFPYFVYEEEGNVVGYAYVHTWKERAAYRKTLETTIYLDGEKTHHGIGTLLMRRLIEECRKRGYKTLIACITGDNIASIEFHKGLGFVQASLFHCVGFKFGKWLDVVDMEYLL